MSAIRDDVAQMKSWLSNIMRILGLLQSFNSEQEKQNESFKSKIQAFQEDLDKKCRLFKAYTAHDSLGSKVDAFSK